MKKIIYVLGLAIFSFAAFSFSSEVNSDEKSIENVTFEFNKTFKKDFLCHVSNAKLETRFETQFYSLIANVKKIDVHFNELKNYYYAVYGTNPEANNTVEYFKTTASEVANNEYNYIEMNEKTMEAINSRGVTVCREASWPFPIPGVFCHQTYTGPICGIVINGYCRYY
ncbi:MAG: hypothetical protein AAF489_16560 [Bacteroidota bacterium]